MNASHTADIAASIRRSPVFASLPPREIEALASVSRTRTHAPREYLFAEGDPARWLLIVLSGRVRIFRAARTGREVVLELLGPGEIVGGVAVIERRPYPASAQCTEASAVLELPADAVVALADRHPAIVRELALMIGRRLRAAHESVKSLSVDRVETRLATTLVRLAERDGVPGGGGIALPFHLTRQSLADMSGTTVESAIRVLSRWTRRRLVGDAEGRLVVRDVEALRAIAGGDDGE
jgi:CRP/FNR family transcriptional regulator